MPKPEEKHKIHEQLLPLKISIDAYQPDPENARKGHDIEGIAKSLDEYHQRTPIVVNTKTATILKGNGTWKAAKELGWTHIAAVVADDPRSVAVGYSIADNLLTDKSVFDVPTLNDIFEFIDDPLDIPGVSADWLEGLGVGVGEAEFPELPDGDKEPFQQMTFTLHDEQAEQVKAAIDKAKDMGPFDGPNENSNGNALARICESFLTYGNG